MISALVALVIAATPDDRPAPKPPPALRVLQANRGVSQAVPDFCSLFSTELTGNYFCLNGDGTQRSAAATTLSAVGSPATQSQRACPNGPNCGAYTSQRITSGNRFATANVASPSGSFSLGCFIRADSFAAFQEPLTHWAGTNAFTLELNTGGGVALGTNDGTATTSAPTVTMTAGVGHLVGASFTFVGAGAVNTAVMYLDGVAGTPSVTMRPPQAAASVPMVVGSFSDGSNSLTGNLGPCFLTEKVITAGTWAAMASALIPTVSGSRGETITYSRASTATCTADDGSVSVLPSGRPCVNGSGLLVEPTGTNLLLKSEQFDDITTWNRGGLTGVAGTITSPAGTATADIVTQTASAGAAIGQQVACSASTTYTWSVWVWTDAGTKSFRLSRTDGSTWATAAVSPTLTATTTPQRFSLTYTTGAADTISHVLSGGENKTPFVPSAGTLYYWGAQLETGSIATSYIPTAGTAAARAAVTDTAATTSAWPTASGSFAVTFVPSFSTATFPASGQVGFLDTRTAALASANGFYGFADSGNFSCLTGNGTTTNQASKALTWTAGNRYRLVCAWSGGNTTAYVNGVAGTTATSQPVPSALNANAYVGSGVQPAFQAYGTLSDLCVSTSPTGCQ